MKRVIIEGPPGTGKTATLLKRLEEALKDGVPAERIAFLTFTRRARREALERVEQVLGIRPKDLPYFRTIHATAFRALKLKEGDLMAGKALEEFGQRMGLEFGRASLDDQLTEGISGTQNKGDALMQIDMLARLKGVDPYEVWRQLRPPPDNWTTVAHFIASYREYKKEKALLDFTDLLQEFAHSNIELPIDAAFIDEAQDLSALQWYAALKTIAQAPQQYVAGDEDQCVFQWGGAEPALLRDLTGTHEVLPQSYRLPRTVHARAIEILKRIKKRTPKDFAPRDAQGKVVRHASLRTLNVQAEEQWLWLVRNRYLFAQLKEHLESQAVVYAHHHASSILEGDRSVIYIWERLRAGQAVTVAEARDVYAKLRTRTQISHGQKTLPGVQEDELLTLAELSKVHGLLVHDPVPWYDVFETIPAVRRAYYRRLLRKHSTLKLAPQVQLDTIHGAKGAEADHVALFLEQSRRVVDEAARDPDQEHRVWYVGATRAREALHVISSQSPLGYAFPQA